jgi:hypothetical protein
MSFPQAVIKDNTAKVRLCDRKYILLHIKQFKKRPLFLHTRQFG